MSKEHIVVNHHGQWELKKGTWIGNPGKGGSAPTAGEAPVPSAPMAMSEDADKMDKEEKTPKDVSMFTSKHMHEVVGMLHHEAKRHAHGIVDASNARDNNKQKARMMIDRSRSSNNLAQGMANFLLGSEKMNTIGGKR